ncbi:MAG: hypothetical protein OEY51_06040 [Cyclobacteriaceae bacterium]|nr:hypothetical protein [Cyclobacteriaceae bacterium]
MDGANISGLYAKVDELFLETVGSYNYVMIKLQGELPQALADAADAWASVQPDLPFDYSFLDEEYDDL